ncbi:MAG: hypothetical protein KKC05_01335 [Nanoarchaeota archaeon]|nr:hypothetical protein [Nanoarchaeota archaeon]
MKWYIIWVAVVVVVAGLVYLGTIADDPQLQTMLRFEVPSWVCLVSIIVFFVLGANRILDEDYACVAGISLITCFIPLEIVALIKDVHSVSAMGIAGIIFCVVLAIAFASDLRDSGYLKTKAIVVPSVVQLVGLCAFFYFI